MLGRLMQTSRTLGFSEASLQFQDRHLTARFGEVAECWDLRVP